MAEESTSRPRDDEPDDDEPESSEREHHVEVIEDASSIPAPSIGPHTTIEYEPPEERLARHEASTVDAMGLDKRRQVIGQGYGPSVARQVTVYGVFLAVVAALTIGFLLLAKELDKAPANNPDEAPWSQQGAEQNPPIPLQ